MLRVNEVRDGFGELSPPGSGFIFIDASPDCGWNAVKGFFASVLQRFRKRDSS